MAHHIPVAAISVGVLIGVAPNHARAQIPARQPVMLVAAANTTGGRVHGFVRDAAGAAVPDARVLAVGQTIVSARSDLRGRFQMTVPPGDYVLRASRDGYVSTYREPVRIHSSVSLERTITLFRQKDDPAAVEVSDSHAHTELAWRLRHLPRSVLRDGSADPSAGTRNVSLFDRAVDTSMRLASRIAATDFTGQVNFVTTANADPAALTPGTPRNVAFIVLGAPVGVSGNWRVRGAVASGAEASWNVLGEYEGRRTEEHAVRFGVSYSVHGARAETTGRLHRAALESRAVTGVFAEDRFRPLSGVQLDYSVRADRYDYLSAPYLLSASAGLRARVLPRTLVTVGASRTMTAPGADEFLPPPADGPWLPPERTFAALIQREGMRPETIRHVEIGLARELGDGPVVPLVHVRAFAQQTTDQIATLFGVGRQPGVGHYVVARAGFVDVSGWAIGLGGSWFGVLRGEVEFARFVGDWDDAMRSRGLRRVAPSAARHERETLNDVSASVEASLNDARTRLSFAYRSSTGFSDDEGRVEPVPGSRFDLQFHQALPYQLLGASRLELVFAVRTLFRDPRAGFSRYDELLTVAPPLRLMGGIQVRF